MSSLEEATIAAAAGACLGSSGPETAAKSTGRVRMRDEVGSGSRASVGAGPGSGAGAGIGAGIGAGAGLLAVLLTRGPDAELPRGTTVEAVLNRPILLDADKVQFTSPGQSSTLAGPPNREPTRSHIPF
jgi:hypothetical protein